MARVGLHEQLMDIYSEITATNFESICDGSCSMDAPTREKCRKAAKRVLELCDQHEKLDRPSGVGEQ